MVLEKVSELMELGAAEAPLRVEAGGGPGGRHRASGRWVLCL